MAVPCCHAVIKGHRVWDPVLQRVLTLNLTSALQSPGKQLNPSTDYKTGGLLPVVFQSLVQRVFGPSFGLSGVLANHPFQTGSC